MRNRYKSENNCLAVFSFLHAALLQKDDLPIPQKIGYIKMEGKATAVFNT
jgi:hypothetical protein